MTDFQSFGKIARFKREVVITEKIDGTNAQVAVFPLDEIIDDPYRIDLWQIDGINYGMYAGSRTRWIAPEGTDGLAKGCDNFAFAHWVRFNREELRRLGEGRHFGEWYGAGIQRKYGLEEKRFALFNVGRWHNPLEPYSDNPPEGKEYAPLCCRVVPQMLTQDADEAMEMLATEGSRVSDSEFLNPEGIIIYHTASRQYYKQTFGNDGGKWQQ